MVAREEGQGAKKNGGFWDRYGQYIVVALLAGYLALLVTGVVAEIFDIQSILDWWIWRPPGK